MNSENQSEVYQVVTNNMIITLSDMITILTTTDVKTLEETICHMADFLPNLKNIPATTNAEALQKTIKNMGTVITHDLTLASTPTNTEVLKDVIKNMVDTTATMINVLAITKGEELQKTLKNVKYTIPKMTGIFSEIDWERFNPTNEDMKNAQKILNSPNIEQAIAENLQMNEFNEDIDNTLKTVLLVLMLLFYTMEFISDSATLTIRELTDTTIKPAVESFEQASEQQRTESKKQNLRQLREVLKKEVPVEMHNLFMMVTNMNLIVFEKPKMNAARIGTIDSTKIVQCMEKKSEWTRIVYDNPRNAQILEGWVLTKYLKKIK